MILALTLNPAIDKVYAVTNFQVNEVFRAEAMTQTAGGKGLNVARVAALLGEPVTAAGFSGGVAGSLITAQIQNQGIISRFLEIKGESRTNIAIMDRKNHTSTEVLEPGPSIEPGECDRFIQYYTELLSSCDLVTASGSLPRGVPADYYRTLAELAQSQGKRFILDSSGDPLRFGIEAAPYMVKPNREECQKLLGAPPGRSPLSDWAWMVVELASRGVEYPCVTLGRDGCVVKIGFAIYHLYGPAIEVVNTVGSGDSFVAGCAVGFRRGLPPLDAFKLGMACGMVNTQFFETGMITVDLVRKYGTMINVETVRV